MFGQLRKVGYPFILVHRPLPLFEVAQCGEGVGILLGPVGVSAQQAAGDAWSAVSSRIATARLKLVTAGLRQAGGGRCSSDMFLMVISVYVITI